MVEGAIDERICVHVYLFVAAESGIAIGDCVDTPLVGS